MAGHTSFDSLLRELNDRKLRVGDVYLYKFGTIAVSQTSVDDHSPYPYTSFEIAEEPSSNVKADVSAQLIGALEKHQNVFDVKQVSTAVFSADMFSYVGFTLVHGPIFAAEIHLPRKQQIFQDMDCPEHFSVVAAGTYFAAYNKIIELPAYSNMAHEFRELYRKQILTSTKLQSPLIGPCPIHSDIYIVEATVEVGAKPPIFPIFYMQEENLCIIVERDHGIRIARDLFRECLVYLSGYYELILIRNALLYIDIEIQNRTEEVVDAFDGFANTSVWKFWVVHADLGVARAQLARIYKLRLDYSRESRTYDVTRRRFLSTLQESRFLNSLHEIFVVDVELDIQIPESLFPLLQFFQQQADAKRSIYSLIIATFAGAVIGAFATLLATLLKHT